MSNLREQFSKCEDAAKRASSPALSSGLIRRRGEPSVAPTVIYDDKIIFEKIEALLSGSDKEELKKFKELFDRIRKECNFKKLPSPLKHVIPDDANQKEYYRYATGSDIYKIAYGKLIGNEERFTEEERCDNTLSIFAFLYNVRKMAPNSSETPEEFYERCSSESRISETISKWNEKASHAGLSIEAFVNEIIF